MPYFLHVFAQTETNFVLEGVFALFKISFTTESLSEYPPHL